MGIYETDFALWTERQAEALRRRSANEIDWENVAEEIETLGANNKRELASRIRIVLDHLIRLRASPAKEPRRGWERTLIAQRNDIRGLLDQSPSLRSLVAGMIKAELPTARRLALLALAEYGETPSLDVNSLDFGEEELLAEWK